MLVSLYVETKNEGKKAYVRYFFLNFWFPSTSIWEFLKKNVCVSFRFLILSEKKHFELCKTGALFFSSSIFGQMAELSAVGEANIKYSKKFLA